MRKLFCFVIATFNILTCFSQSKVGLVHYGEIQSLGMGAPVGPDYNAILVFDNKSSLYVTRKDSLEGGHLWEQKSFTAPGGNRSSITVVTNEQGFLFHNNLESKTFHSRDNGFRYVKEPTPKIDWKISSETKKIGTKEVYKATASFRGRHFTAWFSPDIPLPYGPWKLQGLPGLILEAYDTHKEIYWYFKELEYPTEKKSLLKPIENNKDWITLEEHRKATIKSLKEARVAGRIGAENAGVSVEENTGAILMRFYIENFNSDLNQD